MKMSERPNILFIMVDQMRADCLSCAGHPVIKTPSLDRLAGRGVRFTEAFVQSAVCTKPDEFLHRALCSCPPEFLERGTAPVR